jgi:phosphoserine / homoserine phosphotransferase
MIVACLDMEGVLFPEIWINVAEKTGVQELRVTTRDIADYDELMRYRIAILKKLGISLADIQKVISSIKPMEGVPEFCAWLREHFQFIILSDTFYEFAMPLVAQLGYPTLFCHNLIVDEDNMISGYRLRQPDAKRAVVRSFKDELMMKTIAMGDSYNDTSMLGEAHAGILFRPPQNVIDAFPDFPVAREYAEVQALFMQAAETMAEQRA